MAGSRATNMTGINRQAIEAYYLNAHKGHPPHSGLIHESFCSFLKNGFPGKKIEAWHYMDLTAFNHFPFIYNSTPMCLDYSSIDDYANDIKAILSSWNNIPLAELALAMNSHLVVHHIEKNQHKKITIQNSATSNLNLPIYYIKLEEGATASIHEEEIAESEHLHALTIIDLGPQSQVEHFILADQKNNLVTQTYFVQQDQKSQYQLHSFLSGSRQKRLEWHVALHGEEAKTKLHNISLGQEKNHLDIFFEVEHRAPNCISEQVSRTIFTDKSKGVFNGRVKVLEGADKTDATQNSKNLLLSPFAEINAKPELEIYTDDVKCAHGATVGELDEDALFYLKSRGIPEDKAVHLLIFAFVECLIDKMSDKGEQDHFKLRLENTLNKMVT